MFKRAYAPITKRTLWNRRGGKKKEEDRTCVTCFNKSFRKFDIRASNFSPPFIDSVSPARHSSILARIFRFVRSFPPFRAVYLFISFFLPPSLLLLQSIPVFRITFYTQLLFIKAIRRLEYIDPCRSTRALPSRERRSVRTKKRGGTKGKRRRRGEEIKNDWRGTERLATPVFKLASIPNNDSYTILKGNYES